MYPLAEMTVGGGVLKGDNFPISRSRGGWGWVRAASGGDPEIADLFQLLETRFWQRIRPRDPAADQNIAPDATPAVAATFDVIRAWAADGTGKN